MRPSGPPLEALLVDGLLTALVAHLALRHAGGEPAVPAGPGGLAPWQLRRVVECVQTNLDRDVRLAELAALAGLSQSHFRHAFRLTTGQASHRWLTERRVQRAQALLRDRGLSVAEVALAVRLRQPEPPDGAVTAP